MATEGNVYIDLGYQDLVINIEEPILLNSNPETTNVDLPIIFVQLLAIDAARTSLGNTSLDGRIESEGRYVTLNTSTEGTKQGVVEIITMPNAETCVGEGTKATINYSVGLRTFDTFEINENVERMERGTTQTFTVKIEGNYLTEKDQRVTWSVEGAAHEGTTIDDNGVLTVAADETAETIKIIATSRYDETTNIGHNNKVNIVKKINDLFFLTIIVINPPTRYIKNHTENIAIIILLNNVSISESLNIPIIKYINEAIYSIVDTK